ncbi:MAG TPA: DUF523 and DUF1722 domain-containing protein [Anaeromyxobacteraceae bacterium]|nr:DUF523 and DUF1722 domain-containing protein [Anaeromyxobacteraceae bacterium]
MARRARRRRDRPPPAAASTASSDGGGAGEGPIRVGVSSCLVGMSVRYDGGHKRNAFVADLLGRFVELVAVCPEVEMGLGTPRPAIRLERRGAAVRLVDPRNGLDHTDRMERFARRRLEEIGRLELCGYILKRDSPSCGMERVRLYGDGPPSRDGVGAFARALRERFPLLPVEEEGRLADSGLRENFVERVYAYRRLRDLLARGPGVGDLVRFHTTEKLLLLSHDPDGYRRLGRLVARAKGAPRAELRRDYGELFMKALAQKATLGRQTNVLLHMAGYLKVILSPMEKVELAEAIADFRAGILPLVVPLTLLRHHVRKHAIRYLEGQSYLSPHPKELMLRNHA